MAPWVTVRTVIYMTTSQPTAPVISQASEFGLTAAQAAAEGRGLRHPIAPRFWKAHNLVGAAAIRLSMSFLGMIVASAVILILAVLFIQKVLRLPYSEWALFPARLATCLGGVAIAWALRRYFEQDRTGFMPWQWQGGKALLALIIGQTAATVAIGGANLVMVGAGVIQAGGMRLRVDQLLMGIPGIVAIAYVMQGIPEEMIWRGYGHTVLSERLNPWVACVATGIGFGLLHVVSQGSGGSVWSKVFYILSAAALGLACGGVRQLTGSVWAAAGFHGGMHVTNRVMQAWFTGGEQAVVFNAQGVAMFVVFLACWFVGRRDTTDRAVDTRSPKADVAPAASPA